jgi:hypothetical protein
MEIVEEQQPQIPSRKIPYQIIVALVLFVGLSVYFLFVGHTISPTESQPFDIDSPPLDLRTCSVDPDCVLVKKQCGCSCSGCGPDFDTSINIKYVDSWNDAYRQKCPDPAELMCPEVCCPEARPVCDSGTCSYVLENGSLM